MVEWAEFLPFGAFLHVLGTISLDGRPIIACSQDFRGNHLCPRVVSADSFVDLGQDVLGLLAGDALQ